MTYKTVQGVLHPNGMLTVTGEQLPDHPVAVMVTILEQIGEESLTDLGDYQEQLLEYEERLARGEVQWQ